MEEIIKAEAAKIKNVPNFTVIDQLLQSSRKQGLLVEVVTWSLKEMKNNPRLSIEEALNIGFFEWVK